MNAKCPNWRGRVVVVIASGPSLTPEDCEAVRLSGAVAIVTNTTWKLCPWADVVFGFDTKWWEHRQPDGRKMAEHVFEGFGGRKMTFSLAARALGVECVYQTPWFRGHGNSATAAAWVALHAHARKVVLLGVDCKRAKNGRAHWHPDHPEAIGNCASLPNWSRLWADVLNAANLAETPVLNATRDTALTLFPRVDLAEALA